MSALSHSLPPPVPAFPTTISGEPEPLSNKGSGQQHVLPARSSPHKSGDIFQPSFENLPAPLRGGHVRICIWERKESSVPARASDDAWDAVLICMHGAGDAAAVWQPFATRFLSRPDFQQVRVVATDLRGHGDCGFSVPESPGNMGIESLVEDAKELLIAVKARFSNSDIVIVGHSLGGSVAVRTAAASRDSRSLISAVAIIEAVEGTAIDQLPRATEWLRARPRSFVSLDAVTSWCTSSGMLHGASRSELEASVRARLEWDAGGDCWRWRADIGAAGHHWAEWFQGLSALFVDLPLPKMLMVGSLDRLDANMEASHMQGRFKLDVVQHQGHQLHEDRPVEVAASLAGFLSVVRRQKAAFLRVQKAGSCSPLSESRQHLSEVDSCKRSHICSNRNS